MAKLPGISLSCLCGLAMLSIGACASNAVYDPEPKFAKVEPQAKPVHLTGSRLNQYGSHEELSRDALSPTSVITSDYLDAQGETSLSRFLCRNFPNMVGSRRGGTRPSGFQIGC
ncbi:hypothetical protein BH24PSE2_BH24PSE2_04150 [soil metagenome]